MARNIGVSAVTVKSWLSILEVSYIIHFLKPDFNNLGKSVVKPPKLYFIDVGLMCYLLRMDAKEELLLSDYKGAAVETMAVSELLKTRYNDGKKANLTFFRDKNGLEVDTIADWKHTFAIEVKSNSGTEKKMSANIKKYMGLRTDDTKGQVYYLGDLTCTVDNIAYVSWRGWGRDIV